MNAKANRVLAWLAGRLLGKSQRSTKNMPRFVSRLRAEQLAEAAELLLGRRLLASERAALEEGFRPQGLLSPDDEYCFRIASPRFLGHAVFAFVYALAIDGYACDDTKPLQLTEQAILTFENPGVETPVVVVD